MKRKMLLARLAWLSAIALGAALVPQTVRTEG